MNNSSQKKPWKEMLSEFLSEPTRSNLRRLLENEAIEDNDIDFKQELVSQTELAKHIIAMANKQGGVIIFGLKENEPNIFDPEGIKEKIDPTDLEKKLSKYLSPELMQLKHILPITYTESEYAKLKNKSFILVIIEYDPKHIPFMPLKDGDRIAKNTIYIRRNRATEPATYDDIQNILNRRLETEYSSSSERKLREHLEELKELYSHVSKNNRGYYKASKQGERMRSILEKAVVTTGILSNLDTYVPPKPNPKYPKEDFEDFIVRMISVKKDVIENNLKS